MRVCAAYVYENIYTQDRISFHRRMLRISISQAIASSISSTDSTFSSSHSLALSHIPCLRQCVEHTFSKRTLHLLLSWRTVVCAVDGAIDIPWTENNNREKYLYARLFTYDSQYQHHFHSCLAVCGEVSCYSVVADRQTELLIE